MNHNDTSTGNFSGWSGWTAIAGSGTSTTSHSIHGLVNGKEYRYRLRAVNAAGAGGVSPSARPWYVSTMPAPPNLNAINATESGATLEIGSWNGDWYYRQDYASGGQSASAASEHANQRQCAGPVRGKRTSVGGLDSDSRYTYGAYQDEQCNAEIASAQFNTLPARPRQSGQAHRGPSFGRRLRLLDGADTEHHRLPAPIPPLHRLLHERERRLRLAAVDRLPLAVWLGRMELRRPGRGITVAPGSTTTSPLRTI